MSTRFYTKNSLNALGAAITFPLNLANGRPPIESGAELIKSSLRIILAWALTERFFLGEFGTNLQELIEEPNDTNLDNLLAHVLPETIEKWEPRITIETLNFKRDSTSTALHLQYSIKNLPEQSYTFIYPLYIPNKY